MLKFDQGGKMTKKSKKTKVGMITKVLRLVASLAMIPVFVVPFLNIFVWQTTIGKTTMLSDGVGMFADWSEVQDAYYLLNKGELNTTLMTIASILLIALCVVGAIYIVWAILSLVMPKIKLGKLLSILGWITLILAIATSTLLMITPLVTAHSYTSIITGVKTTYKIILSGITYMVLTGILSGALAIVAEKIK